MQLSSNIIKSNIKSTTLLCLLFFANLSFQAQENDLLKLKIDSIINSKMKSYNVPGLSVGIVRNGSVYLLRGYGVKEIDKERKTDSLTNFHLSSLSQPFTATAIMQLQEEGRLNIDNKIGEYIVLENIKDERFKNITIKQLLAHSSGIVDGKNYYKESDAKDSLILKKYALKTMATKLAFEPGKMWLYSGRAYDLLGYLIEKITQQKFEDYVKQHVLTACNMNQSSFRYDDIAIDRRSDGHVFKKKKIAVSKKYPQNSAHIASGNLNSNAEDMCRWMLENLSIYNDTIQNLPHILKRESLQRMWSPEMKQVPGLFSETYSGLGWFGWQTYLGKCVGQEGAITGYSSSLFIYPAQNLGIVFLVNYDSPGNNFLMKLPTEIAILLKNQP